MKHTLTFHTRIALSAMLLPQLFIGIAAAQQSNAPTPLYRKIEQATPQARGLPYKKPVVYKTMTKPEFVEWARKQIRDVYTMEELRGLSRSWGMMGLFPDGTEWETAVLSMHGENVAAFYDPKMHYLYMFNTGMPEIPMQTWLVLSHELTHALQDQHYAIGEYPEYIMKDNDDQVRAFQAVIEGDACAAPPIAMARNGQPALPQGMGLPPPETGKNAYLKNTLIFPYTHGAKFAKVLFDKTNSFELIDKAYKDMPKSTEQVLHPEKYLDPANRDNPKPVNFPVINSPNWKQMETNVLGEFSLQEYFKMHLPPNSSRHGNTAAAGWGGERYGVYEYKGNKNAALNSEPLAVLWMTVWDTPLDALEFEDLLRLVLEARFPGLVAKQENKATGVKILENGSWRVHLVRKGEKVSLVQVPPAQFDEFFKLVEKNL